MPLVIAFDTFILAHPCNGTHVYAINLLTEFQKLLDHDGYVSIRPFTQRGTYYDGSLLPRFSSIEPAPTTLLKHHRIWRLGGASLAALGIKADLLFSPSVH